MVNASGKEPLPDLTPFEGLEVKIIARDTQLSRPNAANEGLEAASGQYLMFLDEDDWIAEDHVESLVGFLLDSEFDAAYSNTQRTTLSGELRDTVFKMEYDYAALMRDNFMPIHAVLFARKLVDAGCRFDSSLEIFEDWDFWLQVAQHTEFAHLDKITAFYRDGGGSDTELEDTSQRYVEGNSVAVAREKVLSKWLPKWTGSDINRMLGAFDQTSVITELSSELHEVQESIAKQRSELLEVQSEAHHLQSIVEEKNSLLDEKESKLQQQNKNLIAINEQLTGLRRQHEELGQQFQTLSYQHEELDRGLREILNSFSWRITKPYRFLSLRAKLYVLQPLLKLLGIQQTQQRSVATIPDQPVDVDSSEQRAALDSATSAAQKANSSIKFHIDCPAQGNDLISDVLMLRGWALAPEGVVTIKVYVDGLEYFYFTPSFSRPDLARLYAGYANATNCGFFERLDLRHLSSGKHGLSLDLTSPSGEQARYDCDFSLYKEEELYNAWLACQLDTYKRMKKSATAHQVEVAVVFFASGNLSLDSRSIASIAKQELVSVALHYIGDNLDDVRAELGRGKQGAPIELDMQCQTHASIEAVLQSAATKESWILPVSSGDRLNPFAAARLLEKGIESDADLVYCDHDEIKSEEEFDAPVFTFSWSPEHLIANNYVGSVFLVRGDYLLNEAAFWLKSSHGALWAYRLLLQCSNGPSRVERLAEVLWSASPAPAANKEIREKEDEVIREHLQENEIPATLVTEEGTRSLCWNLIDSASPPKVSIIIPTMGKLELVRPCLQSLVENTDYANYEVVILDNSRGKNPEGIAWLISKEFKVIECDEAFNWSRLNNIGAAASSGELLLFLNDDIEIRQASWLEELVRQAIRPEVGAVGCKLLYPNGALQHAGVFLVDHGGGGSHLFHKMPGDRQIYQRLDLRVRETSAVTGACLIVSRDKFEQLEGFDEELAVVSNDVDFCLRLLDIGKRNLWTPRCTLIHHESISREASVPLEDEQAMWRRWGERFAAGDPYYNPNLTQAKWDCSQDYNVAPAELLKRIKSSRNEAQSYRVGVNLIGYIRADMGLGEGARSDARALEAAELDFGIINFETANPASMSNLTWRYKEMLNTPFDVNLIHINADFLPLVFEELPQHFFGNRYNIAYWAWELEELPENWLGSLKLVDEIWVPSEFVKQAVEKVSDVPVKTLPHNVALAPSLMYDRLHFGMPDNCFAFLAMYDTHSIAERKNPKAALLAFQSAFKKDDFSVCLVLKLNNATEEALAELDELIGEYENIVVLRKRHSREEIDALLTQIDCYVSLHRSEGFGLGPLEAMSLGKPCILTNWSGNTDYMTEENCLAVDYELITLTEDYGPYNAGQRWADADVNQASDYMQRLVADSALVERLGRHARKVVREGFSPEAVGELMKARLSEIRNAS